MFLKPTTYAALFTVIAWSRPKTYFYCGRLPFIKTWRNIWLTAYCLCRVIAVWFGSICVQQLWAQILYHSWTQQPAQRGILLWKLWIIFNYIQFIEIKVNVWNLIRLFVLCIVYRYINYNVFIKYVIFTGKTDQKKW